MSLTIVSEHRCYQGVQRFYAHASRECATEMRFAVYTPPQAATRAVPVLYYLAGLTCTEETFMIKAGAQRLAAQMGLMLVSPDTSPRKSRIAGDDASWDFGLGAGFYVDAVLEPWSAHYRMYSYVTRELPQMIASLQGADVQRSGIFGHSMGGHGALVAALRNPEVYRSVSALAPIAAPTQCPWGQKAFRGYLGNEPRLWSHYDATALVGVRRYPHPIFIDQGMADKFLAEQLKPELFATACQRSGTLLQLRKQEGYDHGYYFISTFIEDHLRHHAQQLCW
jgi:S-formylglutathione hydrolase